MNNKFLDKVCDQIISETRIIDDKVYTLFSPFPFSYSPSPLPSSPSTSFLYFFFDFLSHCKEVYSLNKEETDYVWEKYKEETDYVWEKYKEGLRTLMEDKEPAHQEKG